MSSTITTEEEEEEEANKKKIITLKSSDGKTFQVDKAVVVESQTIQNMTTNYWDYDYNECAVDNEIISLPNVTGKILSKVIEYCKRHHVEVAVTAVAATLNDEELKKWDAEFVKKVNKSTLLDLILAANYLEIKSLSNLTCLTVANMIKGKTPEEIRTIFNLTPEDQDPDQEDQEEEEEVRKFFE